MWPFRTMEYYLASEKKNFLARRTAPKSLEDRALGAGCQTQVESVGFCL